MDRVSIVYLIIVTIVLMLPVILSVLMIGLMRAVKKCSEYSEDDYA